MPRTPDQPDEDTQPPTELDPGPDELGERDPFLDLRLLDPGAPEASGELPSLDEPLDGDALFELGRTEPEGTRIRDDLPRLDAMIAPTDDLEDFATQETIPILPWKLDAEILEIGHTVPAVLDPMQAKTIWERPDPGATQRLTVRLRMVVVAIELEQVAASVQRLRVGRDILSGRALILVE